MTCVCFGAVLVNGCKTSTTRNHFIRELSQKPSNDAKTAELIYATPIIDVHTHNFNGRDIPVRNIALGRRDVLPPWSWLATDSMAKLLAAAIVSETDPEDLYEKTANDQDTRAARARKMARIMNTDPKAVANMQSRSQYSAIEKALDYANRHKEQDLGWRESLVLRTVAAFSTHSSAGIFRKGALDVLEIVSGFLADLVLSDSDLCKQYWKENSPDIRFRLTHMMDMGPTYGQEPGRDELRPFKEEIDHIAELQNDPDARMTYFVAYNPFRDNINPGESLGLVQYAIRERYAYGVKIYPPAGYRPSHNEIPHRPWTLFSAQPKLQWDSRYTKNQVRISNAELDNRLLSLLCWCASNDIPVFSHSGYGEFQGRSGYGQNMPNPKWWAELLREQSPIHPELSKLRLCFGHAGGADSFFGGHDFKLWSQTVVQLCRSYPNIYCEVGCLDQILDSTKQAEFAASMDYWCNQPKTDQYPYSFGKKIMYGSDWFMPIQSGVDRKVFLQRYREVFVLPELQQYYRGFFLTNALAYLNAVERIRAPNFPISQVTKSELSDLIDKAQDNHF